MNSTLTSAGWQPWLLACLVGTTLLSPRLTTGSTNLAAVVNDHCDLRILYQPLETNALAIVLRDEDQGRDYRTNEVILLVPEEARVSLPAGTPFGDEGAGFWLLPQGQDPGLLYLGVSAEGVPLGAFGRPFNLRLIRVEGPGDFFAWQAAELGGLSIKMNSRDGIGEDDKTTPIVGSHEHLNWGFTTNGVYHVTFQADGQRVGESTNLVSEPSTFTFHVLPLPAEPPRLTAPRMVSGGLFTFDLFGGVGTTCRIEFTTDFETWIEVKTVRLETLPVGVSIDEPPPVRSFYRALQQ
jgi:surface-anchored protein